MTRRRLPPERPGVTRSLRIHYSVDGEPAEMRVYATKSFDAEGRVCEIILTCNKQGSMERGLLHTLGVTASLALQSGVTAEKLAEKWRGIEFEPQGLTGNPDMPMVKSIVDYLARWIAPQKESQ